LAGRCLRSAWAQDLSRLYRDIKDIGAIIDDLDVLATVFAGLKVDD
jgi:hypothetical protein